MTNEDAEKNTYLKSLEKHAEDSRKIATYSIERIDLLTISVSGAGIYACLEILKYCNEKGIHPIICFKIIGVLFSLSIILNFISQWTAYYASYYNMQSSQKSISDIEESKNSTKEIEILDYRVHVLGSSTTIANLASTILMLAGLISITTYISIIF